MIFLIQFSCQDLAGHDSGLVYLIVWASEKITGFAP